MREIEERAQSTLDEHTRAFYRDALRLLIDAGAPFLVGGAYAFQHYTGIERHTKDFDIFVHPRDCERILHIFANAGYQTDLTFPHWLGKVYNGYAFVDVIFSSGNGVAQVDDDWFARASEATVFGIPVKLIPPEEMLWSKMFVMERERYDGADVAHLIRAYGDRLNWQHLIERFDTHWRVLFSHLVLYGFIYPAEQAQIPDWVLLHLSHCLHTALPSEVTARAATDEKVCGGTLISREQYLHDTEKWGYVDGRIAEGHMTPDQVRQWTDAIDTIP
jgi:hypothetical protein